MARAMNDEMIYAFAPSPARASFLDRRVRMHLAASLQTIFDSVQDLIDLNRNAAETLLRSVRAQKVSPVLFGLYSDFVMSAFDEEPTRAEYLLSELLHSGHTTGPDLRVVTLDDAELGEGHSERYKRMVNDAADLTFAIAPVSADERFRFEALLEATLSLLEHAAPEFCGELRELVRELVLIDSRAEKGDASALVFDGASTFYLWGALFLNSARQTDRVTLAAALTHESAHSHLFGISMGGPLVINEPDELYESPLRFDPRPMDGLVHATYVLARMAYCMQRLMAAGCLSCVEANRAAAALAKYRGEYQAGLDVVTKHARFTPEGAGVFEQARRFMATAH
jgi:hypothetical protein